MQLLQDLLNLKYCKFNQDKELDKYFKKVIKPLNLRYVFNPSFYYDSKVKIFAFRSIPRHNDYNVSFVSVEDKFGQSVNNISIDLFKELGGTRLIDPEVFKVNDEFFVTFNSGWIQKGNDIFVMKIYPEMGSPKRIIYKNRQKQERNWAFFSENDQIYALYWINPLKILKVKNINSRSWEMEDCYLGQKQKDRSTDFTIGTQLSELKHKYYFIAHKKYFFCRKKIYIGKLCSFDFKKKKINSGKYWLVHSFKSLFGNKVKTNTNLFSCTYFSGLQASNGFIRFGYGINDLEYNFAASNLKDLGMTKGSGLHI